MKEVFIAALTAILGSCLTATSCAQVTDAVLAAGHRGDPSGWPSYGGSYGQMRYSDLDQINRDTVKSLRPAWVFHTGVFNMASGFETTPVVFDGAMYITTPRVGRDQWVIKLDARTGKETWRTALPQGAAVFCCGANNRGATLYNDKVYVATIDASLYALDQKTGKITWRVSTAAGEEGYSQTSAPLAFDNKIILGVAGGEYGVRGFLKAFDAETGALLWTWYTVPAPEDGGWHGTWQETLPGVGLSLNRDIAAEKASVDRFPDTWQHGGGAIWTTPSLDAERRLVYVITGNPGPDFDGTVRPGDNRWSDSICAIRADDGTLAWAFQYLPHDIWDSGGPPPILFDVEWEGRTVPAAGLFTKIGYFYLFDRESGELLKVSEPYAPQQNFLAPLTAEGIVIAPGSAGGSNWSPTAYSPQTRLVYTAAMHWPMRMTTRPGADYRAGTSYQGGNASFGVGEELEKWGLMTAIDPVGGKVAWQERTNLPLFSGVLATAGGVVFAGQSDDSFDAWDAQTGAHLWKWETDAGCNAAPMTYELDGKQYLVVASGGSRYVRRDRENPVAADAIIAFALP